MEGTAPPDAQAAYALGTRVYDAGDAPAAVRAWRRAAHSGHAAAAYDVGTCYIGGHGVCHSTAMAVVYLRRAAELGHAARGGEGARDPLSTGVDKKKNKRIQEDTISSTPGARARGVKIRHS